MPDSMRHLFEYHQPDATTIIRITVVREKCADLCLYLEQAIPPSAERTLAIRRLHEFSMLANSALVLAAPDPDAGVKGGERRLVGGRRVIRAGAGDG